MRALALRVALLIALTLTAGCSMWRTPPQPTPAYEPIPDDQLYDQLRALPEVTGLQISYVSDSAGRRYVGVVLVPDTTTRAAAAATLDHANAILWQGRAGAASSVQVSAGTVDDQRVLAEQKDVVPQTPGVNWLQAATARYGPQPGDGIPPAGLPTP